MAKVIGALIWAEEDPVWLMAAVTAVAPALDHLVALDGKYALYPGALSAPASGVEQSLAIVEACAATNLGLTLYRPNEPFMGNEVEKRNMTIQLAKEVPGVDDDSWMVVFDGDMVARKATPNVKKVLLESDDLVAEYARFDNQLEDGHQVIRGVYRLVPGLEYGPAHYTISAPMSNGERLWFWGQPTLHRPYVDEALDLTLDLQFNHRNEMRVVGRNQRAREFYKLRDELGIEKLTHTYMEDTNGELVRVN